MRRFRRRAVWGMVLAAAAAGMTPVHAQQQSFSNVWSRSTEIRPREIQTNSSPSNVLNRTVSVSFHDIALVDAVQMIAKAANVKVTYTDKLTQLHSHVSFDGTNVTLKDALGTVLRGTSLVVQPVPPNEIVIAAQTKASTVAQDSGAVHVVVVDSSQRQPIPGVMVELQGTSRRYLTDDAGRAVIRGLGVGEHVITVRRIGYATGKKLVTLRASQDTTIMFVLPVAATSLTEVVTTGSGERPKIELGNSIATMNADSVMATTPVSSVSQLLANRLPGLRTTPGSGAVGSPTRLRIRGMSSIESDNAPIIILDGVRISNGATTTQTNTIYAGVVGGSGTNDLSSRLDDLDPNTIESIEELKGPAASTLYGSDAANGVIVIKTKRGKPGPARWGIYVDRHNLYQPTDYDFPVSQVGYPFTGGGAVNPACPLSQSSLGYCTPIPDSVIGFNMLKNPRFTPQAVGHTQTVGVDVSGGTAGLQYYMNGTYLDELGTAKLPDVNAVWITDGRGGNELASSVIRPNARTNATGSARMTGTLMGNSDFSLGATFASEYDRVGNDGMSGLLSTIRNPTDTTPVAGWENFYASRTNNVKHITGNATMNWRPSFWNGNLTGTGTYGWDFSLNDDFFYAPKGSCQPLCDGSQDPTSYVTDPGLLGYVDGGRSTDFFQTFDFGGVYSFNATPWLQSQTAFGGNYVKHNLYNLYGSTSDLRLGQKFYAANGPKQINDIGDARATAGWYIEQRANFRQDVYLTLGLRQDAGSALGNSVNPVYPKFGASWVVSNAPFFPKTDKIDIFQIRGAFGNAGVMPATNAKIRTYAVLSGFVNPNDPAGTASGSYAQLTGTGNPDILPEHSHEAEGGFHLEALKQRISLDYTYYSKFTHNAISRAPLAGSVGAAVTYLNYLNVGDVSNHGYELEATFRVIDRDAVSYSISGNMTGSNNKLVSIAPGVVTFQSLSASGDLYTGNDSKIVVGYPLFGRWAYPLLGWDDANGNGVIDPWEVRVGDSLQYVGPTEPKTTVYVNHTLGFFRNRLTINANFSYSSGETQYDQQRESIAQYLGAAAGIGSLKDQACVAASQAYGGRRATDWCFMETVKELRFQDLAVNYTLDQKWARMVRASSAIITLSGSNLHLWTNYKGQDPDINTTPVTGNAVVAGTAFATPREFGLRVRLGY